MQTQFDYAELQDIATYGANQGWAGLIYYSDTSPFHDAYASEIWNMLAEDADDMGMTPLELIATFNGAKEVHDITRFKNLLAWYAAERTATHLIAEKEILNER